MHTSSSSIRPVMRFSQAKRCNYIALMKNQKIHQRIQTIVSKTSSAPAPSHLPPWKPISSTIPSTIPRILQQPQSAAPRPSTARRFPSTAPPAMMRRSATCSVPSSSVSPPTRTPRCPTATRPGSAPTAHSVSGRSPTRKSVSTSTRSRSTFPMMRHQAPSCMTRQNILLR